MNTTIRWSAAIAAYEIYYHNEVVGTIKSEECMAEISRALSLAEDATEDLSDNAVKGISNV